MRTDTLKRRLRFAPPAPTKNDNVVPQGADLAQWEAISRHGPLPITYLKHFGGRQYYPNLQRRYTRFFHTGWVSRPPRQFASFHARYSPLVYDLTPKAIAALGERACPLAPSRSAPFVHQLMQACVTASLEIRFGDDFIPRDQLLDAPTLAIDLGSSRIIPDDAFALRLPEGKKRFFLLEVDRNTESIERKSGGYNTWSKKAADYDRLFSGELKRAWGIPRATVLVVTTNERHLENIKTYVKQNSRYADRWQYALADTFGPNWRVPKDLLTTIEPV